MRRGDLRERRRRRFEQRTATMQLDRRRSIQRDEPRFREAAAVQRAAQQQAGGARRAADELERYLNHARGGTATNRARGS